MYILKYKIGSLLPLNLKLYPKINIYYIFYIFLNIISENLKQKLLKYKFMYYGMCKQKLILRIFCNTSLHIFFIWIYFDILCLSLRKMISNKNLPLQNKIFYHYIYLFSQTSWHILILAPPPRLEPFLYHYA